MLKCNLSIKNLCNQIKRVVLMKNEKKRRRFHEKLIHVLYPPSDKDEDEEEETNEKGTAIISHDGLHLNNSPEGELEEIYSGSSSSDANEDERDDDKKLTRAQRKRLRRKKLKEEAIRRRKIIGPLLSNGDDDGPEGVRRNVSGENSNSGLNKPEKIAAAAPCTIQNKVKQRRMSRKLAREKQLDHMNQIQEEEEDDSKKKKHI